MSLISGACNTFEWIVKFLISLRRFGKERMHALVKLRLISDWILARVEYSLPNHITMYKCSRFLERVFICKGGGLPFRFYLIYLKYPMKMKEFGLGLA